MFKVTRSRHHWKQSILDQWSTVPTSSDVDALESLAVRRNLAAGANLSSVALLVKDTATKRPRPISASTKKSGKASKRQSMFQKAHGIWWVWWVDSPLSPNISSSIKLAKPGLVNLTFHWCHQEAHESLCWLINNLAFTQRCTTTAMVPLALNSWRQQDSSDSSGTHRAHF